MASIGHYQGNEQFENCNIGSGISSEAIAQKRMCVTFSAGKIVKTTADTQVAVGLTDDSYASGDQVQYIKRGRLMFLLTGAAAVGDPLCPDNATPGYMRVALSGDRVCGTCFEAGATGEWCVGEFDFVNTFLLA